MRTTNTYIYKGQRGITDLKGAPEEIWTQEEFDRVTRMQPIWDRWNRWYVGWLKRQGRYGEEYELHITMTHNPIFDEPKLLPGATAGFSSYKMLFLGSDNIP